jgi:HEAT repeat protein
MALRDDYLRAVLARHEVVHLPLEHPDGSFGGAEAPLPAIFQPLALRPAGAASAEKSTGEYDENDDGDEDGGKEYYYNDPDDLRLAYEAAPTVRADGGEAALAQSPGRRMVILGGPGTGKTTLLRALVSRAARRALEDPSAPLPIAVDLPDLAEHGADLRSHLARIAHALALPAATKDLLAAALDEGSALVCLDGLDEVAPARRGALLAWLASLGKDRNAWAIGSRYTQYRSGDLGLGVFTEWELLPLDDAGRRHLAERLLHRLAPADAPPAARDVARFLDALKAHPQAETWMGVPLLFSLTAAAWARRGALPASRAVLYQLVVDALLAARAPKDPASRRALRAAIAHVARELFRRGGRTFSRERLREAVTHLPDAVRAAIAGPAETVHRLAGSGLLEPTGDELRFGHQTLHEYLVAVSLAEDLVVGGEDAERAWALAWSKRTYARWSEPLRLMVGVLVHELGEPGASAALRFLRALAAQRQAGDPGDLSLGLLVRSLGEVGEPPASWPEHELAPVEALLEAWTARVLDPSSARRRDASLVDDLAMEVSRLRLPAQRRVLDPLSKALVSDADARRREAAARAIERLGASAPLEPLLEALKDASPSVRWTAAHALQTLADRCPPAPLLAAMRDREESVRNAAAKALGALGDRAPLDALLEMLRDPSAGIRVAAIHALEGLGERTPLAPLIAATKDGDWNVRSAAVRALGVLGDRTARHEAALDAILAQVTDGDRVGMRVAALGSLRLLGDRVPPARWVDAVLQMLDDEDSGGRSDAARLLGALGARAPFDALIARLGSDREAVAQAAASALVTVAQFVPIWPLVHLLRTGSSRAQQGTLRVLGFTAERAPVEAMVARLSSEDPAVRAAAARALGWLRERAPVEPLVRATRDKKADVRSEALVALARLGSRAPIDVLVRGLSRVDLFVQQPVVAAIGRAGGKLPLAALRAIGKATEDAEGQDMLVTADQLFRATARCTDVPTLLAGMRGHDENIASMSAMLLQTKLERGEADEAIPLLVELLEQPAESDPTSLQEAARQLLASLGKRVPDAWLSRALAQVGGEVRARLRTAAVQIASVAGDPACVPQVCAMLDDENDDAQRTAHGAAARLLARKETPPEARAALFQALAEELASKHLHKRAAASKALRDASAAPPDVLLGLRGLLAGSVRGYSNTEDRAEALMALRHLGAAPDLDLLVGLLGDGDWRVRREAVAWLQSLGERAPVEALVKTLRAMAGRSSFGPDEKAAVEAAHVLGTLGDRAPLEPLLEALDGVSYDLRDAAGRALAMQGARVPLARLLAQLESRDPYLRRPAVYALAHRHEPEAIAAITRAIQDSNAQVCEAAFAAIHALSEEQPALLPVELLVAIVRDGSSDSYDAVNMRRWATHALSKLGERAPLEDLVALLGAEERSIRAAALWALGSLGERTPVDAIAGRLGDHDREVRVAAAKELAELGDRVPIDVFLSRLDAFEESAQPAVAKRIAMDRSEAARAALRRWLSQGGRYEVAAALLALPAGTLDDLQDVMLDLALDASSQGRAVGLSLLEKHAQALLSELAEDAARVLAGEAPRKILAEVALRAEIAALGTLPRWPADVWDRALTGLHASLPSVRVAVIAAMAHRSPLPDRALAALWSLRDDASEAVRRAADEALGKVLAREGALEDDEA